MTNDDPLRRLEHLLERWWPAASGERGLQGARPSLKPEVTPLDALCFLEGFEGERPLMRVEGNRFISPLLPRKPDGSPKAFGLFEGSGGRTHAFRSESVAHYGTAFELVRWWGWPIELVECEPLLGDGLDGAVDILVRDRNGAPLIIGEAKATGGGLEKLIRGMTTCAGEPSLIHPKTDHKKCLAVGRVRPRYFFGIACGPTRRLFRVRRSAGIPRLTELANTGALRFK